MLDDIHEECGVAAVQVKEGKGATEKGLFYLYKLMLNLQNRGQLSAGFTTYSKNRPQLLFTYKDIGSVNEVFKTSDRYKSLDIFRKYAGNKGIGHVRYATCGRDDQTSAQPFERSHGRMWKWFSIGFNGQIANYRDLRQVLLDKAEYHIVQDVDTEIIQHYISRELNKSNNQPDLRSVFNHVSAQFDGCYNIVFINAMGETAAIRDPNGFRPVNFGNVEGANLVASESNALENCGISENLVRPLDAGQMAYMNDGKIEIKRYAKSKRKSLCMFEYVYFSNVSSLFDDVSVYGARARLGQELAKLETEKPTDDHVVVPVPDTAKAAGDAMAYQLGIPSKEGLIRNRFVGRTFIEGVSRQDKISNKYSVLRRVLQGKKVLLVDDSLVRGSTARQIVRYIKKEGGAKEVHLRLSCPPIIGPCFYGIDMSTVGELLSPKFMKNPSDYHEINEEACEKIASDIGADSVIYQTIPGLVRALKKPESELCLACLNAKYPTPYGRKLYQQALSDFRKGRKGKRTYE
ncbi:MAG TPA: amidophosphoribosyltransferase [Candidatus Nanoarchaeia archaeon]|nr:amidophosphoribosyltransferase [Candidatus Nanoarchaeia archaeon]